MTRRYAEGTDVSVGRSRGEIDDLLRSWGCSGIAWLDDFDTGESTLQFRWKLEDQVYLASFKIAQPDDDTLRRRSIDGRTKQFSETKYKQAQAARGRQEHRVLAIWIKAALNAIDAGIIMADTLFLPWLVGKDGRTVAEVARPRLHELLQGSASRLLGDGKGGVR